MGVERVGTSWMPMRGARAVSGVATCVPTCHMTAVATARDTTAKARMAVYALGLADLAARPPGICIPNCLIVRLRFLRSRDS